MNSSILLTVLGLVLVFWGVGAYQRLKRQRGQCNSAYESLPAELAHRHELVPVLVEAARSCLKEERALLERVIGTVNDAVTAAGNTRQRPLANAGIRKVAQAEHALDATLGELFAAIRSCADLQGDAHMRQVMDELAAAQHKVTVACAIYNQAATQYNTARSQFPGVIIAVIFAFRPVPLFNQATGNSSSIRTRS